MDGTPSAGKNETGECRLDTESSEPLSNPPAPSGKGEHFRRVTLLIVDDVLVMRLRMRSQLEEAGYRVLEAENGEKALEIIQKEISGESGIDLVITDVSMPVMDGLVFIQKLRQESGTRELPVIICTARGEIATVRRAKLLGVRGFLVKPVSKSVLLAVIKRELTTGASGPDIRTGT